MANSTVEVYEKIRVKLGEEEARALLDYVDARIEREAVTKLDLKETEDSLRSEMQKIVGNVQEVENSLRSEMQKIVGNVQEMENSLRSDMQKIVGNVQEVENSLRSDMQKMENSLRSDMQKMENSLRSEMKDIEWRSKLYFILIGALIIITNPKVLELIGRVMGLVR